MHTISGGCTAPPPNECPLRPISTHAQTTRTCAQAQGAEAYAAELQAQLADSRGRLEAALTSESVLQRQALVLTQVLGWRPRGPALPGSHVY